MEDEGADSALLLEAPVELAAAELPAAVEILAAAFRDNPLNVAVIGEPDAICGEVVKAVVSVKKNGVFDRASFDAFVTEHLAKHKRPRIVEIVEGELPKNFLGKVLRRKLRTESVGPTVAPAEVLSETSKE